MTWKEKEDSFVQHGTNAEGKERGDASVRRGRRREGGGEKPVTEEVNTRR